MATYEEAIAANRPRNEVKKLYAKGSPGYERKGVKMTLSEIKKGLASGELSRRGLRASGLLAP